MFTTRSVLQEGVTKKKKKKADFGFQDDPAENGYQELGTDTGKSSGESEGIRSNNDHNTNQVPVDPYKYDC